MSEFVDQIFHVRAHKGSCFLRNLLAPPGEECLSIKHHWFGVCQGPQKYKTWNLQDGKASETLY